MNTKFHISLYLTEMTQISRRRIKVAALFYNFSWFGLPLPPWPGGSACSESHWITLNIHQSILQSLYKILKICVCYTLERKSNGLDFELPTSEHYGGMGEKVSLPSEPSQLGLEICEESTIFPLTAKWNEFLFSTIVQSF